MKKIIIVSMLAISFIATAQLSKSNHSNFRGTLICSLYNDILIDSLTSEVVEEDAPFDFDTKEYLPLGFNSYAKKQLLDITEVSIEEDAPFDFDTKEYLPLGFDANMTFEEKYEIVYEINLEEADEAFDFNTANYLAVGFNLNKNILNSIVEIVVEEADESFDFDTKKYLPIGFDTYLGLSKEEKSII